MTLLRNTTISIRSAISCTCCTYSDQKTFLEEVNLVLEELWNANVDEKPGFFLFGVQI